jgi:hypothetical protein
MAIIESLLNRFGLQRTPTTVALPGEDSRGSTERGARPTPENSVKYLYRRMWVDPDLRAAILDIRAMDRGDGRVKKIHGRMARTAVKSGLLLKGTPSKRILRAWADYIRRLHLTLPAKLESDARGLVMEGNLPMQWVLDPAHRVVAGIRMPSETLLPKVGPDGRFENPAQAYEQYELHTGTLLFTFPLWQLTLERLTPDNYDDMGSMGRPYLDASRSVWKKLMMTDEDLVIRRRTRAPLRFSHTLEGATTEELEAYESKIKDEGSEITTDFFSNRKGSVTAVQGDASLDQIADVSYLLDTFFAGSPAPKGLFGFADGLQRDILEDMKRDYFDEIDALQNTLASVYAAGFRLDLLLQGINPDNEDIRVDFAERRTETPNQATDRALKQQALGAPPSIYWQTAGLDVAEVKKRKEEDARELDPYPDGPGSVTPKVSVTPGNRRKGESATDISTTRQPAN